jgi:hypothetical protein
MKQDAGPGDEDVPTSLSRVIRRNLLLFAPALLVSACATEPAPPAAAPAPRAATPVPDGSVRITQTQASFIGSVSWGQGTLMLRGQRRQFRIRGLGVGGLGVARMSANGEVYNLSRLSDFSGVYGLLRAGVVAGDLELRGGIWLQNPAGVRINLRPTREGLALHVGADGILIELR